MLLWDNVINVGVSGGDALISTYTFNVSYKPRGAASETTDFAGAVSSWWLS